MPSSGGRPDAAAGWLVETAAQVRAEFAWPAAAEDHLDIAGHQVRIRYADMALADALGRATRHLKHADPVAGAPVAGAPVAGTLTIDCWTEPPSTVHLPGAWPATGTMHVDDGSTVLTWDAPDGPLFVYDRTRGHAWARFASLAALSAWERATPFRRILHWWAADHGLQLVHAAAVGHAAGGVLLVGRSGSGKSTTALACLEAGIGFAGDDYCLLAPGDPPRVYGLYLSGKADDRAATLLPGLREAFALSPLRIDGKSVVFADQIRPDGVCPGFPLRGIVVPRVTEGSSSHLSPLRPADALRALAPSTLLQMPGNRAGGLERLAAIVRHLPAWELALGSDPATAAATIRALLDGGAIA
jgi:hypothetical protein